MSIQWFPGHMAKARREITEKLKLVDIVIELLDARIPISSRNPMIDEIVKQKPRIVLLNKSDLADPKIMNEWAEFFEKKGLKALSISSSSGRGISNIFRTAEELVAEKREALIKKGVKPRAVRAMILGIPNVGKSSLINRLANRSVAKTGDRPGVTKGQQWIKVGKSLELLDTPGILWPKFEDVQVGYRLAATGAIKDELLHFDDIALFIVDYFKKYYPEKLKTRYNLDQLPSDNVEIIELIGRKRGCLISGGKIDFDKAAEIIVRELRAGKLGRFCLEKP
ncbi:ribosome biogenesis GTPase YlqF [Vulcanibacillus modesticaldus]|uniref:Ribosome biogenesis GTPase A n=1 Tax=Vulcanibacillus modesticaldus TaxID=337097 RepID=A0A1D2YXE0_9BACI|nr:ribosome biogenesis GTPase YlqF [Vulcanibacillus modesticaldus]OEG00379.1 ribosome biogenesis GTPase YlqF [Vulcanibacillus modesticaldus]